MRLSTPFASANVSQASQSGRPSPPLAGGCMLLQKQWLHEPAYLRGENAMLVPDASTSGAGNIQFPHDAAGLRQRRARHIETGRCTKKSSKTSRSAGNAARPWHLVPTARTCSVKTRIASSARNGRSGAAANTMPSTTVGHGSRTSRTCRTSDVRTSDLQASPARPRATHRPLSQ